MDLVETNDHSYTGTAYTNPYFVINTNTTPPQIKVTETNPAVTYTVTSVSISGTSTSGSSATKTLDLTSGKTFTVAVTVTPSSGEAVTKYFKYGTTIDGTLSNVDMTSCATAENTTFDSEVYSANVTVAAEVNASTGDVTAKLTTADVKKYTYSYNFTYTPSFTSVQGALSNDNRTITFANTTTAVTFKVQVTCTITKKDANGNTVATIRQRNLPNRAPSAGNVYLTTSSNITKNGTYALTAQPSEGSITLAAPSSAATLVATITPNTSGDTPTYSLTVSGYPVNYTEHEYYFGLIGPAVGGWNATNWASAPKSNLVKDNCVTVTVDNWNGGEFKIFRSKKADEYDAETYYSTATSTTGDAVEIPADTWQDYCKDTANTVNMKLPSEADGSRVVFTIAVDDTKLNNGYVSFKYTIVPDAYLPLSSADFKNGKKHYFVVGSRTSDFRLLPEWELEDDGNGGLILRDRPMFSGYIGIAMVDNYADYANHRYTYYNPQSGSNGWWFKTSAASSGLTSWGKKSRSYDFKGNSATGVMTTSAGTNTDDHEVPYWAREINVTLDASGNPTNLAFTFGTEADYLKEMTFTLVGSNFYNPQFMDKNGADSKRKTPGQIGSESDRYDHVDGWGQGYVQYDEEGQPYYDAEGTLLPQTLFTNSWLVEHPSWFSLAVTKDGKTVYKTYSSTDLMLVNVNDMTEEELAEDPYANFYKVRTSTGSAHQRIGGDITWLYNDETQTTAEKRKIWDTEQADNYTLSGSDEWECYVARNVWMSGMFKIWSGHGANNIKNEPWADNNTSKKDLWFIGNGGPSGTEHNHMAIAGTNIFGTTTAKGEAIANKTAKDVDDCNYNISGSVFCERIILWYNTKDRFAQAYVELILADANPSISAAPTADASAETPSITYDWQLENADNATNLKVLGYTIKRYQIVSGSEVNETVVQNVDLSASNYKADTFNESYDASNRTFDDDNDNDGLNPGTYLYKIEVRYKNELTNAELSRRAVSNRVIIYGSDKYTPQVVASQLLKLKDAGFTALGITPEEGKSYYLTYNTETSVPKCLITKPATGDVSVRQLTTVELAARPDVISNPAAYDWTTDYFVRALDVTRYTQTIEDWVDQGRATLPGDEVTMPEIKIYKGTSPTASDPAGVRYTLGTKDYYGNILPRGGEVKSGNANVQLSYNFGSDVTSKVVVKVTPTLPQARITGGRYTLTKVKPSVKTGNKRANVSAVKGTASIGRVYYPISDVQLTKEGWKLTYEADVELNVEGLQTATTYTVPVSFAGIDGTSNKPVTFAAGTKQTTLALDYVHPDATIYPVFDVTPSRTTTTYTSTDATVASSYNYSYEFTTLQQTTEATNSSDMKLKFMVRHELADIKDGEVVTGVEDKGYNYYLENYEGQAPVHSASNQFYSADEGDTPEGQSDGDHNITPSYYMIQIEQDGTNSAKATSSIPYPYLFDDITKVVGKYVGRGLSAVTDTAKKWAVAKIYPVYLFQTGVESASNPAPARIHTLEEAHEPVLNDDGSYDDFWPETNSNADFRNIYELGTEGTDYTTKSNYIAYLGTPIEVPIGGEGGGTVTMVENVVVDNADAEVEYYNLQGIRVVNPEAGQVYIRRQGANVSKVVL